jgi:hypothetical protein
MADSVSSVGRVGSSVPASGASVAKGFAPVSTLATGQASSMPGRASVSGGKAHESEFTKAAHLSAEAQEGRLGASASGNNRDIPGGSGMNTDPALNPAIAAVRGFRSASANSERISEM